MKIQAVLFVVLIAGLLCVSSAFAETEPSPSSGKSVREGETSVLVKEKPAKAAPESRKPSTRKAATRNTVAKNPAENSAARQQVPRPAELKAPAPPATPQPARSGQSNTTAPLRLAAPLLPDLPGRNAATTVPPTPRPNYTPSEVPANRNPEPLPLVGPRLVAPEQAATQQRRRQAILPDMDRRDAVPPAEPQPPIEQNTPASPRVTAGMFASFAVPVYPHVRVKDSRNIAPGAAPMLVAVKDPQACKHDCDCCRDRMVFVQVWAPPYGAPRRKVSDGGREVELDYGEYEVEIESKHRGYVEIDYDD